MNRHVFNNIYHNNLMKLNYIINLIKITHVKYIILLNNNLLYNIQSNFN